MMKSNKNPAVRHPLCRGRRCPRRYLSPLLELENGTRGKCRRVEFRPPARGPAAEAHILGRGRRRLVLSAATVVNTSMRSGAALLLPSCFRRGRRKCTKLRSTSRPTPASLASNSDAKAPPLFLTQWNHREWALVGVARGTSPSDILPRTPRRCARLQRAHPKATMIHNGASPRCALCARLFLLRPPACAEFQP